jgi:hypothetical protein
VKGWSFGVTIEPARGVAVELSGGGIWTLELPYAWFAQVEAVAGDNLSR